MINVLTGLLAESAFVTIVAESCAKDEQVNKRQIKKPGNILELQALDAAADELCTGVGLIKYKNTHNGCCYYRQGRFTEKIIVGF